VANISDKNPLTIGLLPYELEANAYIEKNRKILERIGTVVPVPRPGPMFVKVLKQVLKTGRFRLYDVLIINWRENTLRSGNNTLHPLGVLEYFLSLLLHRAVCGKLIYVKHNSHPHNLPPHSIRTAEKLVRAGQRLANAIVVHSPEQAVKRNKTLYVPHPLYDVQIEHPADNPTEQAEPPFVMIGRVQPYKKIDEVIANWEGSSRLVILGPSSDNKYLRQLEELAENRNIEFEIDFHPEHYLAERVSGSKGVIITNDNNSMLVSGSFFFAISCGARVYATDSLFFEWVRTTSLAPYLFIADTLPQLTNLVLSGSVSSDPGIKSAVRAEAEKYFGDKAVEDAWRKAIT